MIKQLLKSKEEAIEKYISKFKIVLHAEEMQKIQFWSGTIEEQQLALIQEIKDWAEKDKKNISAIHCFNWKEKKNKLGNKIPSCAKHYAGGEVNGYNEALKNLLKELDNIKK